MRTRVEIESLEGDGPRILLLPGLGARGAGYRALAQALRDVCRPLLVEYPEGEHAAAGAARLAAQVAEAAGPFDAAVVSSMGGLVGAHLATGGHLSGLAFLGSFTSLEQLGLRGPLFRLMGPIATWGRPGVVAASIASGRFLRPSDAPTIVPTTRLERQSVWHRAFAVAVEPPPPSIRSLPLACVAIQGNRDVLVPPSTLAKLGEALPPGTPLHLLEGAGHVPYWSHPEETAALLKPWVGALRERISPR